MLNNNDYFKVLLVASSGKGKTYTARDLDSGSTGFINAENKPLPFKKNFLYHTRTTKYTDTYNSLIEYGKNSDIQSIYIDSFSAYADSVLREARKSKKGFDIWSMYNDEIGKFLELIKSCPKHIFVTAHYEILGVEGNQEKRVKVKAKEWEGQIEKEFTVVLFGDSKFNDKTGKPEYWYNTFQEGTSAKCPPELFGDTLKIPNSGEFMLNKINEFTADTVKV